MINNRENVKLYPILARFIFEKIEVQKSRITGNLGPYLNLFLIKKGFID